MERTAYLFQASLIFLWWLLISLRSEVYEVFAYASISKEAFFNLLIPDLALLGVLSLVRAYVGGRELGLIILGAFAYATLFCVNASVSGGDGLIPTLTMAFGLIFNVFLCYPTWFMRRSSTRSLRANGIKTGIQIFSFWLTFLGVFPFVIQWATLGLPTTWPPFGLCIAGSLLFGLFSILGLSSAFVMVRHGEGTPLPFDATNKLVVVGPYQFVRNPMAIAGTGQILAIALILMSLPIAIYALVGALAWHWVIRPIEEVDLLKRFGNAYQSYRAQVFCWLPLKRRNP